MAPRVIATLTIYDTLATVALVLIVAAISRFYEKSFGKKTNSWLFGAAALVGTFGGLVLVVQDSSFMLSLSAALIIAAGVIVGYASARLYLTMVKES